MPSYGKENLTCATKSSIVQGGQQPLMVAMPNQRLPFEYDTWHVNVPRLYSFLVASYGLTRTEVVRAGVERLLDELTEREGD